MDLKNCGFLEVTQSWSWVDFGQTLLGAFLGFLFAIASSMILDCQIKRKERKTICRGIVTEFNQIIAQLNNYNFETQFLLPLSTAYWTALIHGSKFGVFYKANWYPTVSLCYSKIDMLNIQINLRNSKKLEASMLTVENERIIAQSVCQMAEGLIAKEKCNSSEELLMALLQKAIRQMTKK
ncbi:hypothetical protein FACS1894214_2360 [Planctomycetales bacterium]|nr:hypothetical protein FACS1894214_2360 [Planctomycetales bacterium]